MVEEDLEKELAVAEKKAEAMLKEMERTEPKPVDFGPIIASEEEPKIEETLVDTCEDRIGFVREIGKLDEYKEWLRKRKVE